MNFIKNLTKADLPALKKFIKKSFHDKYILLNDDFFNWQYKDIPGNIYPDYAMKIIKSKDKILGYNGVIPMSIKFFTKDAVAGIFANLMVDKKCRGFGLGAALIKTTSDDFPICYINGYNLEAKIIYQKLGRWQEMGVLRRFIKILNAAKVEKLIHKKIANNIKSDNAANKDINNLLAIKAFNDDINLFWENVKKKYPITINRNKEYLNWRYANHPLLNYQIFLYKEKAKIKAYIIIRIEKCLDQGRYYKIGRIIDFISKNKYEEATIRAAIQKLKADKVDLVDFLFSGNFHVKSLKNQGFKEKNANIQDIPLVFNPIDRKRKDISWIIYFKNYPRIKKKYTDCHNWYITKGDGDQDRPNIEA